MNEEQVRKIIREELAHFMKQSKFVFDRPMQIMDGNDITLAKNVGTRIGTEGYSASSGGQKLAFFGKTPRVQYPTGYLIQPSGGGGSSADAIDNYARARIGDINALLVGFGFAYDVT
jgi:hypothetical protein